MQKRSKQRAVIDEQPAIWSACFDIIFYIVNVTWIMVHTNGLPILRMFPERYSPLTIISS